MLASIALTATFDEFYLPRNKIIAFTAGFNESLLGLIG